jgi:hypothetical protein
MIKLLKEISWDVDEPTYRADEALSYSTIARFAREGFNKLDNLFDKLETPSLTFGSAVDALITGGQEEFDNNFIVADFPTIPESIEKMVRLLFDEFCITHRSLKEIPDEEIIGRTETYKYQLNWRPETRAKVIREQGEEYYSLLYASGDKKILDTATKEQVDNAVKALKNSSATKFYFASNNQFDQRWVREYQLKFKATLNGVNYRCMADLVTTDHENKIVYPIDLKTSSHTEWDFFESFIQWRYDIQARLYWRIIRDNMDRDPVYKDYELADYRFVVVNKKTLTPLVWKFEDTKKIGTLTYGKRQQIELQDPFVLGETLAKYLSSRPEVPIGIETQESNSITKWLNTMN